MRIVVLEDEPLYRDLLVRGLSDLPDIQVTGAYSDGVSLLRDLTRAKPQAAVLDLVLEPGCSPVDGRSGIQVGLDLRRSIPHAGIVLLSNYADPRVLTRIPAEQSAGWAYLLKRSTQNLAALDSALHSVVGGSTLVDPQILGDLGPPTGVGRDISAHAMRILAGVASGASNVVIAEQLGVSVRGVENSISALIKEFAIDTKTGHTNARVALTLAYLALAGSPRR